ARDVPRARAGMAGERVDHVQALDAEEPSAHRHQAPVAALRRHGALDDYATGDSGVRGTSRASGICAKVDRQLPRRPECGVADGGEVGVPAGQSRAWSRSAGAQNGAAEMGADTGAGGSVAQKAAAAATNDGGPGAPVGAPTRRTVRAALAGSRS